MPKCVFLVDDSPAVRHSLRTILESAGIEVCGEAEDGAKAIEKAKQLRPDLIVLDLAMPVMNGLQAAPILRAMHPATPIILFTLYADSVVEHEALLAGISSLVSKGEGSSHLIDEVNTLLKPDVFEDRKAVKAHAIQQRNMNETMSSSRIGDLCISEKLANGSSS